MNSAIQCLSHVKVLTNYFLRGVYVGEINKNNPLGSQGAITSAFAKVIWQLWEGNSPVVIPTYFKTVISSFKKQFANLE